MSANTGTLSTGTTAVTTIDDNAVNVLTNANAAMIQEIIVYNSSTNLGFVSFDGGVEWCPLPAGASATFDLRFRPAFHGLKVKRVPAGGNVSVYAFAY